VVNLASSASLIAGRLPNTSRNAASLVSRSASAPASAEALPEFCGQGVRGACGYPSHSRTSFILHAP
jgi:hypothetical protein